MLNIPRGRIQYCDKPHDAIRAFAGENIEEILDWYERMIEFNPDNKGLYFGKSDLLAQKNRFQEAITVLDFLLTLDDSDSMTWYKKGEMLGELGRNAEALECLKKAVSLTPLFENAWCKMGEICLKSEDYSQAREVFQRVVDINPRNTTAVEVLLLLDEYFARSKPPESKTEISMGEGDKSENDLASDLDDLFNNPGEENPQPPTVKAEGINYTEILAAAKDLLIKGKRHQENGEFIKALRNFNQALELNSLYWDAWRAKGDLFLQIGKMDEASFCYYKALYLSLRPLDEWASQGILTDERKYDKWRESFFSSLENIGRGSDDT